MSFGVQDVLENEVRGTFLVLSPSAGRTQYVVARSSGLSTGLSRGSVMAEQSDSSVDDTRDVDTPRKLDRRRSAYRKTHSTPTANEDSVFLRHLELEPPSESGAPSSATGRTPFTTTRKLVRKPNSGFGFSVAWTQPPRVERVEAGLPADKAGLRPGDYIIFVESHNVVTMPEEEILSLIRLSNNHLTLEVYRRTTPNGVVLQQSVSSPAPQPPPAQRRSASVTDCSAATSLDLRRRLQLPQVAFTTEHTDVLSQGGLTAEEARKRAVYQLLQRLQNFALVAHFGVERFLLPLSDRKDLLTSQDHLTLFQNMEELVMLTEELLEQLLVGDDADSQGAFLGRVYLNKIQALTNAYRKYCMGLKRADCLLAQKTASPEFMRVTSEPPIPKRRPDLTTFIHKPLEHYRETLKLLQTVLKNSKVNDDEYACLTKVVQALQTTYRDITANSGLMEPDGDGRLLLSLQDLESRLVFTKCKPFVLSTGGRQWIFGGDLSRVDGRALRPFWALLFTDLLLLAKVSRDRVLFVTDEPISLLDVTQACFSVKKKETEFRLIVDAAPHSPAEVAGAKQVKTKHRRRSIAFRAPTPELKAVWQNLLQRQIIYLNTVRGGTPNASPLDSPAEQPSLATADSPSRVQLGAASTGSQRHLDQLIEQKCRLLGKSGLHKGSALHLQQWMTGQLGAHQTQSPVSPEEPEPEIWSPGTLRKRGEQLMSGGTIGRTESRCDEYEMSSPDPERSLSRSTDDSQQSQITVKSGGLAIYKKTEGSLDTKPSVNVESKVEKRGEPSPEVKVVSSASSTSPSVTSQTSNSPNLKSVVTSVQTAGMCKDCLETCAGQNCPSAHRTRQKVRAQILELWRRKFTSQIEVPVVPKPRADSSSDYDSEEGDRWEPLPSELGINLQRDPFYPQDEQRLPTIAVLPPTPSETRSLSGSTTGSQKAFDWDGTDELVAAAEACAMPDDEDEDDNSEELEMERAGPNEDGNPPYRSLSNSNLRKYGTLTSLENVENANDETTDATNTADESDDDEQYIEESPNESFATVRYERSESSVKTTASSGSGSGALVTIDAMHQSLRGWSSRHGATVAEKTKHFEKISEQSRGNHVSIERFLPNPLASGIPPIGVFSIPRTISSSIFVPGNDQPTPPKTPPQVTPRVRKQDVPRTVAQLSNKIPTPATVPQPVVRHTVVMGTTATLKSKAPAVPVRSKIYSSFKSAKAAAPPPPIPAKPLDLTATARPKSPEISTSAAAAAAIAAANQVGSPDSSVSDKDEWGTPEGNDPDDTEEELSSTQDIVSLFPCVGSDQLQGPRSWSPDEDDQLTTLLSAPPRVFPRRRLEPLYEEEDGETQRPRPRLLSDSSSSGSSTPEHPKVAPAAPRRGCMVPGQGSWADVCADNEMTPAISGGQLPAGKHPRNGQEDTKEQTLRGSSGLLQRLKLASSRRRGWGGVEPIKTSPRNTTHNKMLHLRQIRLGGLLGNNRSEDNNGNNARGILRIFGNNNNINNNAANNTVNNKEGTTARLDQKLIALLHKKHLIPSHILPISETRCETPVVQRSNSPPPPPFPRNVFI